jgi:hypothetical protein
MEAARETRRWPPAAVRTRRFWLTVAPAAPLVSGLRQAEHMARPDERGAVIACYYALAYLGFAVPYLADGLGVLVGKTGAFVVLTAIIAGLALWTGGYTARLRRAVPRPEGDIHVRFAAGGRNSVSRYGNTSDRSG